MASSTKILLVVLVIAAVVCWYSHKVKIRKTTSAPHGSSDAAGAASTLAGASSGDASVESYESDTNILIEDADDAQEIQDLSQWDSQFKNSNRITQRQKGQHVEQFSADGDDNWAVTADDEHPEHVNFPSPGTDDAAADPWKLYDAESYMPQEKVDDWFQTISVPQKVKDQHLLMNPIGQGISTVGNSKRIKNLDLRPAPFCPKFAVSPWGNSSYDPSTSRKSLC